MHWFLPSWIFSGSQISLVKKALLLQNVSGVYEIYQDNLQTTWESVRVAWFQMKLIAAQDATLNSPISVDHSNSLEPTSISSHIEN